MPQNIYTQKTVRKLREKAEVKRNFLRELFFKGSSKADTEVIMLELEKGGEYVAPLVTPLESGRLLPTKTRKTNQIIAPNVAPKYTLTPKDYFTRPVGGELSGGESPTVLAAKRLGKILKDQENTIVNREELMVAQFITTGKVTAIDGDAGYEVDYELENIETLAAEKQWDKDGVDPLASVDELVANAEKNGVKVENIVMGRTAAKHFIEKLHNSKKLSKDLQSEVVKKMVRENPGVTWLGTYTTYGIELYRYDRSLRGPKNEVVELIASNVVAGGPSGGEIVYAPIIYMGGQKGAAMHMVERYSGINDTNIKTLEITTESRPVLQPVELTGYFAATVCPK